MRGAQSAHPRRLGAPLPSQGVGASPVLLSVVRTALAIRGALCAGPRPGPARVTLAPLPPVRRRGFLFLRAWLRWRAPLSNMGGPRQAHHASRHASGGGRFCAMFNHSTRPETPYLPCARLRPPILAPQPREAGAAGKLGCRAVNFPLCRELGARFPDWNSARGVLGQPSAPPAPASPPTPNGGSRGQWP